MLRGVFGNKDVSIQEPDTMSGFVRERVSKRSRMPVEEYQGVLEKIAAGVDQLAKEGKDHTQGFRVISEALDIMYKEFQETSKKSGDSHSTFTKETEQKFSSLRSDFAKAVAREAKQFSDKAVSLETELGRVSRLLDGHRKGMTSMNVAMEEKTLYLKKLIREIRKQLKKALAEERGGSGIMILANGTMKSSSAFSLNFKTSSSVTPTVADNPNTGALDISFSASATAALATEALTGTQSGGNVTLDLTQLAHTFSAILLVTRQGQIVTPGTNPGDGSSRWSRSSNTITIYNADAAESFLVQYTY